MTELFFYFVDIFASNKTATAATFAAAITAALAALKFYSDKAAKVTDFRKAWIETLRQAVSEFSGSTHTIAGRIVIRIAHGASIESLRPGTAKRWASVFALLESDMQSTTRFDKELETELMAQWAALRLSHNKIVLHLNPTEHSAYIAAEAAVAQVLVAEEAAKASVTPAKEYTSIDKSDVVAFLCWCIDLAESRTTALIEDASAFWWKKAWRKMQTLRQPRKLDENKKLPNFDRTQTTIHDEGLDAASCLLLSAFATKRLLYGKYPKVAPRIAYIEKGIRVVDTSAALVIKRVWEQIKKGEPAYRFASALAILISLSTVMLILLALFMSPQNETTRRHDIIPVDIARAPAERT